MISLPFVIITKYIPVVTFGSVNRVSLETMSIFFKVLPLIDTMNADILSFV
jgi:hypothetical protein